MRTGSSQSYRITAGKCSHLAESSLSEDNQASKTGNGSIGFEVDKVQ